MNCQALQGILFKFVFLSLIYLFVVSCSPTRYVPDGEYLLNRNKIVLNNKNINKEELASYIRQKPNKRIVGFRFHLFLYNLSNIKKENWINKWLRSIGEEPVINDSMQLQRSIGQMTRYLHNKGFYNATVKDTFTTKHKKADMVYTITPNKPYIINAINYQFADTSLRSFVLKDTINSLVIRGNLLDADVLQNERKRLEGMLKNQGYYSFSMEYIFYLADTSAGNNLVNLQIGFRNFLATTSDNQTEEMQHPRYRINDVYVYSEYDTRRIAANKLLTDKIYQTKQFDSIHFVYTGKPYIKPKIINQSIYVQRGKYYSQDDVDKTYLHLTSLRVYKFVDMQFEEVSPSPGIPLADKYLNCNIRLSPLNKQSYTVEVEGTNSSGIFGVAGNLNYSHKNLFRGAEIFDIGLKGGVEVGNSTYLSKIHTIVEFGVSSNIRIPKFWLPFKTEQFIKRFNPKTNISLAYNFQRRPDYTRTIANTSFGYTWKGNGYITHVVNPVELNAVKISADSLFLKEIGDNSYLKYSYEDHFVSVSSYSLIYNNQKINKTADFQLIHIRLESAGNILAAFYKMGNKPKVDGQYQLFGLQYSQFIRGEFDFRYYMAINKTDKVVYRLFMGAAYPYGNSRAIPFEKAFYSGGFNSIRAWAPRTLGPGSYKIPNNTRFPNSTADMKLEANLEYRYKLFWILEGALFADAGNIWAITKNDTREGALFKWNSFLNDMAVGVGTGLRFDFSFFIFSMDAGLKTRDPAATGNKWFSHRPFSINDFTLNVGIGYPF